MRFIEPDSCFAAKILSFEKELALANIFRKRQAVFKKEQQGKCSKKNPIV